MNRWAEPESVYEAEPGAYENVRSVLSEEFATLSDEELEQVLAEAGLSAEELENFGRFMGRALRTAAPVAAQLLPVVAGVAGGAVGGPVGAALGGAAGQALGGLVGQAGAQRRPAPPARANGGARPQRPPPRAPVPSAVPARIAAPAIAPVGAAGAGGGAAAGPAAAQLLQMVLRPETLQSLLALVLRQAGAQEIRVGETTASPAAFANALAVLAQRAAGESQAWLESDDESLPAYLVGADGEAMVDVAVPEERAEALLAHLWGADPAESDLGVEPGSFEYVLEDDEDLEAMYDELDLEELYELSTEGVFDDTAR